MDEAGWRLNAADAIDAEALPRILERIQALPEITRQVATLRKSYGLEQGEIAQRLGLTPDEVLRHLSDAVNACADMSEVADG